MALEPYVEQADRSPLSGVANEDIYAGELINDAGSGVNLLEFADVNDTFGLARYDGFAFAREHEDEVREDKYVASNEQRNRVQYQPNESDARVYIRTINETTTGVTSAPNIGHRDVVGIVDETDADAPTSEGRIVEEGYTNDENDDAVTTTYNRSNGNFKAVGRAYRPEDPLGNAVTGFDRLVRVELFEELKG